jgi:GntR family transcriptional regulator / MocR family aminotransferase
VEAGLQTAGWLSRGIDSELAAAAAAKRDVEVTPLSRYSHGKMACEGLQLGFAAMDATEIQRGVRELAIALEGELKTLHRSGSRALLR